MDTKAPPPPRLAALPAMLLRRMILDGDVSIPELLDDNLAAIEERDGRLHAFVATCPERARREAREAQERLRSGDAPPLLGLPLAVKDAEPVAGLPFGSGSLVFAGRVAEVDSVHVARLRAAGAIVVGDLLGAVEEHRARGDACHHDDVPRLHGGARPLRGPRHGVPGLSPALLPREHRRAAGEAGLAELRAL